MLAARDEEKIKKTNPGIGALELDRLSTALWEKNYRAVNIKANFDKQIFVEVWRDLVSQGHSSYRISTYYTEIRTSNPNDENEWECQGRALIRFWSSFAALSLKVENSHFRHSTAFWTRNYGDSAFNLNPRPAAAQNSGRLLSALSP